ncbi:M48 family metalloprotease [Streptomyces sp. MZ04]|uniref:M48 family metalloprotease n=1 Tax=Streptomyces sp. MZ04 TaxID=2559236 RepID=UPI00107E79D8|nr:M48 family metalloprotease [Streptomyces sp. MZ04]TGB11225.1 peptidase [Streptomyces sp. MZ04]
MSQPHEPEYPEHIETPEHIVTPSPADTAPRPGRVHIAAPRRSADAMAISSLALHLPHTIASLAAVTCLGYLVESWTGLPVWATAVGWLLSGGLVFHHPTEAFLARHVLGYRPPSLTEQDRLAPPWHDVTARFGVDSTAYQLWIHESGNLNAEAAAGRIVAVTSAALRLPPDRLAAVLAHELGHHVSGHSWTALLTFWYALPARLVWQGARALHRLTTSSRTGRTRRAGRRAGRLRQAREARESRESRNELLLLTILLALVVLYLFPWLILLASVPWLLAAVKRRAELRADRCAAARGFGPQLAYVLEQFINDEEAAKSSAADGADRFRPVASLLSPHPDLHTRLQSLQRYLEAPRP